MIDDRHMADRDDNPFVTWGKALLDDPNAALANLLSGAGTRGTQQQAEPADFLADLVGNQAHKDSKDRLLTRLDTAVLEWLKVRRTWPPGKIIESGTRAYLFQVADALKIAARLPLKVTAGEMIRTHYTWDDWVRALRLPGDIDLLRQFDIVLIRHQADRRFTHRWFAACDEAAWGGPYWQARLRTGLLGLRKIPATGEAGPEMAVAAALVRFGVLGLTREMQQAQVETAVRRQAGALAVLYPRHAGHWQNVWATALAFHHGSGRQNATSLSAVAAWLGHAEARAGRPHRDSTPSAASVHCAELPDRDRLRQIEREIADTDTLDVELWNLMRSLVDDHWRYALESGDGYFAVRTTVNLCNQALRHSLNVTNVKKINSWAVQAIEAEPDNPFGWDLWAKTFTALGHNDIAAAVRWESIRRFPANAVLYGSLAHLLVTQDKLVLAEALLRETIVDFPRNVVIRHILTLMLWKQRRHAEAAQQADILLKLDPKSVDYKRLSERIGQRSRLSSHDFDRDLAIAHRLILGLGGQLGSAPVVLPVSGVDSSDSVLSQSDVAGFGSAYITQLRDRKRWTELFFAPSMNGADARLDTLRKEAHTSELAMVAAHRAGLMNGSDNRAELRSWAGVHPSSYSARLLLALREHGGLEATAMHQISDCFPQHRRWNQWLCYGFATHVERNQLRQEAQDASSFGSWFERLRGVYPDLANGGDDDTASIDAANQRRLVEEIAFAAAEPTVPSFALTA